MAFRLRPDQERVAAYRRGYMAVPAVPGAGKTTVLAYLAADLIASGLPAPGRILIVTYTHSAVGNFKSRIGDFLHQRGLPPQQGYEVRTIHSLAMQIVRERPAALGWSDGFAVIDEGRLADLLQRLTWRWIGQNRPLWESLLKESLRGPIRQRAEEQWEQRTQQLIRSLIQTFKSRQIDPAEAYRLTRSLPEESALRWAAEVYGEYQRELAALGAVDFGDLMMGAHRLLTQEADLLARLQRHWTYLFEDEAQDSYRLQERVLRLLAGPGGNLVRVGDANQAIMGTFTSAEPDLFRRFCRESGVALCPLTMAGRSSPDIIDLANELVEWTRQQHPEPACRTALEDQRIQPVPPDFAPANPRPKGYRILGRSYETQERELQETARLAARSVERAPEKSLAILLPTNAMVTSMLELLERLGAPASPVGGQGSRTGLHGVRGILAVLRFLGAPHDGQRLSESVQALLGDAAEEGEGPLQAYLRNCRPEDLFDLPADDQLPWESLYRACPSRRGDPALAEAMASLARWLAEPLGPADEWVVRLAAEAGLVGEELTIAHHLALRAHRLMLENPSFGLPELADALDGELQAVGRFADGLYDRQGFQPEPGLIYVTTCHAAKGLEWDTVYLPALTRSEYPSMAQDRIRSELWFLPDDRINPEALALAELDEVADGLDPISRAKFEQINERLRLFYVAITRAKENLLLSYHQQDRWGKPAYPALAYLHLKGQIDRHAKGGEGS